MKKFLYMALTTVLLVSSSGAEAKYSQQESMNRMDIMTGMRLNPRASENIVTMEQIEQSPTGAGVVQPKNLTPAQIKIIQNILTEEGYYKGRIDGVWGKKTRHAIQRFQKDRNLTFEGRVLTTLAIAQLGLEVDAMGQL